MPLPPQPIFVDDNNHQLTFYVGASIPNASSAHDGLNVRNGPNVIVLGDPNHIEKIPLGETCYSYLYVEDCIKQGCRLDLAKYKLQGSGKKAGRNHFTEEDKKILRDWVLQPGVSRAGNAVYEAIEKKHPHHSAQSWRAHFVKQIEPNLKPEERAAMDSYQGAMNELTSISKAAASNDNQSQAPEPRQTQNHERITSKTKPEASMLSATSGYTKPTMQSTSVGQHQQAHFKSGQQSPPQSSHSLVSNQTARSPDDNQGLEPTSQLLRRRRSGAVPPPDRLQKLETQGDFLTQAFQQSQWSQEDEGEAQRLQVGKNGNRDMILDDDDREMDRILAQTMVHEITRDEQDDYFELETPAEVKDGAKLKSKNIDGRADSANLKTMGRSPTVAIRASATVPTVKLKHEFESKSVRRRVSEGGIAAGRQQRQVYQTATRARTCTQDDTIDLTESTPEAQVLRHAFPKAGVQQSMTPLSKIQPHSPVSVPTLIPDSQVVRQATTTIGKRQRIIVDDDDEYDGTIMRKNGAEMGPDHCADKRPRLLKQQQQHQQPQLRSEPYPAILPSKFFSAPSQDGERQNPNQFSLKRLQPLRKDETSTAADQDLVGSSDLENELDRAFGAQRVVHLTDSCRRASDPTPVRPRIRTKTRQSLPHPRITSENTPDDQQLTFMRMLKSLCIASGCTGEQALGAMKQCSGNWRVARRLLCMERGIEEEEAKNGGTSRGTRRISAYAENEKLLKLVWTAEEDALLLGSSTSIAQLKLLRERKGAKAVLERETFLEKLIRG
ncbi:hypothetical protein BC937DRAFT_94768 [Endogone sp. FLAS-F59071]|nr:hypothetical protein BC937DRAFT_94768 [Endogone sp. FLAS-F59071]|eukprot:RUS20620.1 hypothetical protein BC937DRAFT_94768 [Endogone sp. FLAS-F59071]